MSPSDSARAASRHAGGRGRAVIRQHVPRRQHEELDRPGRKPGRRTRQAVEPRVAAGDVEQLALDRGALGEPEGKGGFGGGGQQAGVTGHVGARLGNPCNWPGISRLPKRACPGNHWSARIRGLPSAGCASSCCIPTCRSARLSGDGHGLHPAVGGAGAGTAGAGRGFSASHRTLGRG